LFLSLNCPSLIKFFLRNDNDTTPFTIFCAQRKWTKQTKTLNLTCVHIVNISCIHLSH
jgi:hypothetical protein